MMKTVIGATIVGILGARMVAGAATLLRTAAVLLAARVLFTAAVGFLPLLVVMAAADESAHFCTGRPCGLNA